MRVGDRHHRPARLRSARTWIAAVAASVFVLPLTLGAGVSRAAAPGPPDRAAAPDQVPVCLPAQSGFVSCDSIQLLNPQRNWQSAQPSKRPVSGTPSGYYPADLQDAYGLAAASTARGGGATVAVVDAYDDPNALSDLSFYRTYFNSKIGKYATAASTIPPICSATVTSGCVTFTKYNQTGSSSGPYPRANVGWAEEISLDLDMVSAICPRCDIALVEANSNRYDDLADAVDTAKGLSGVVAVSNSYGSLEFASEGDYVATYSNRAGMAMTVSSGDDGYGAEFPASSPYVTAVGGTRLTHSSTGWHETVWSGAGSGCSAYQPRAAGQGAWDTACSMRTVADVAAVADPYTGVAVYDTFRQRGWLVFGGTSVSAPLIAAVYGLTGSTGTVASPATLYGANQLTNIVSGSNGNCGNYLCNADPAYKPASMPAYDGPTGNGTPNGLYGF